MTASKGRGKAASASCGLHGCPRPPQGGQAPRLGSYDRVPPFLEAPVARGCRGTRDDGARASWRPHAGARAAQPRRYPIPCPDQAHGRRPGSAARRSGRAHRGRLDLHLWTMVIGTGQTRACDRWRAWGRGRRARLAGRLEPAPRPGQRCPLLFQGAAPHSSLPECFNPAGSARSRAGSSPSLWCTRSREVRAVL